MSLRLGFHYHVPMEQRTDGLYTPGYQGRFLDSLAPHCERLICFMHSPLPAERDILDYRIQSPNCEFVDIGPHVSVPRRTLSSPLVIRQVRSRREEFDVILIRGPSPLLPVMAWAVSPKPVALLLVGDYLAGINDLPQPWWRKELIRLWALSNSWAQLRVAKRALTFVNSRLLYQQLQGKIPHLIETRTTTLSESDFFFREDACQAPPYRLLYTGRISVTKGLVDIVEALAILVSRGIDVIFDLAGPLEPGDPGLDEVYAAAESRGVRERVHYHGYRPVGPELFELYRQADIFVIASRSSFEGFPRVIWEAMAHSLPVIATRVGAIPHYLIAGESAMLISPRSPEQLADSIIQLIMNPQLRQTLIRSGRTLAQANTLEARSIELIHHLKEYARHDTQR